ncbi:hypothetical protein P280DRAFT_101629 [Massarina eburnea CBS 473.64]|uniref:Uncharacterized protein n=1 Tax=Massarina eburnea CBS 473.64 TaxID=1395130 RepID=A0A6A6RT11_9PLEO|nr:hypothetical protein P280DRAFT_101629 [Massarina eburnea CBS 473.64]
MMDNTKARSTSVSSSTGRTSLFPPLSDHGMPKSPSPRSPDGKLLPHRFSGLPPSPRPSGPLTPKTPPMSAKSFGTFIDSEPSTPARSPRTGSSWDNSTLVLLTPVPSPSTPAEPPWDMVVPMQEPPKRRPHMFSKMPSLTPSYGVDNREVNVNTSLSSNSVRHIRSQSQKEMHTAIEAPIEEKKEEEEEEAQGDLKNRIVTKIERVKSLCGRKSDPQNRTEKRRKNYDTEKKKEKEKKKKEKEKKKKDKERLRDYELQRMVDSHWTEL